MQDVPRCSSLVQLQVDQKMVLTLSPLGSEYLLYMLKHQHRELRTATYHMAAKVPLPTTPARRIVSGEILLTR